MTSHGVLNSKGYQKLDAEDFSRPSDEALYADEKQSVNGSGRHIDRWRLSSLLFCTLTIIFCSLYIREKMSSAREKYEHGWTTDFVSIRGRIGTERRTFTGAPAITSDGTVYVPHQDSVRYVGLPSPEVDQAWEQLVGGRYILITQEEAIATWGSSYGDYWSEARGGYVLGLDVFHTLHCLNQIREKLHPEYYTHEHRNEETKMIHHGHCIEQIRQYIMCAGDLTALGTRYYSGIDRNYVLSDVAHTCRDFQSIREWTWERYNGSTSVKPVRDDEDNKELQR